ncbi:long-chain fatty acid--CoA ligase [Kiloniella laminariae]|uniref:Long-chain fatty acid--CoA ligase n=1 Tax=Kiloniella laminariae TaxID=454162 RepID=A0ABT4LDL1_9PROT|nr:long-chain fatty acid--CoA ligase [Kiloniella laminariae]MCZ4279186.1 long-chain fatty acid--CoA ligase [Kiloniella laminariae]
MGLSSHMGRTPLSAVARKDPVRPGNRSLYENLEQVTLAFGQNSCVEFLGRDYSYREILDQVHRVAAGLQRQGVKKGDRVVLFLPNSPYFVVSYYAILKIGAVVVNSNPLYAESELEHQLKDSGAEVLITIDIKELCQKAIKQLGRTPLRKVVICRLSQAMPILKGALFSLLQFHKVSHPTGPQILEFEDLASSLDGAYPVEVKPADLAVLQYTGGTTGAPKGAALSHANVMANTEQVTAWFSNAVPGEERILGVLPLFHVFAMTTVLNMGISLGAQIILLPRFQLGQMLKTIDRLKPTLMMGVPTLYNAVNNSPVVDQYDLSSIKYCISGGAPLPLDCKHRFEELTGCVLVEGYGLSEASPVCACNPVAGQNKEGSIGLPMPGTLLEIRSPEAPFELLPKGDKGELCITGPQVMTEYWHNSEATEKTICEGRLRSGDIGYMDKEGYVFLLDRLKDLILCNGYNVYPRNIEEAINRHPAVAEVTVIGVPDKEHGEIPKAFVKLHAGQQLSEADLQEFLQKYLSVIERPRIVEFRKELPKTMIGKLSKKELRQEEQDAARGRSDSKHDLKGSDDGTS